MATTVELTPTPVITCFCKWENFSTTLIGIEINLLLDTMSELFDSDIILHCICILSPWLLDPTLQEEVEESSSSSRLQDDFSLLQLHSVNMACNSFLKEADDLGFF
jgi:hypothetical protein